MFLSGGEFGVGGVQSLDYPKRTAVCGDDIAKIDKPLSRPAVDGRANRTIIEVEPSVLHGSLVLLDLGLRYIDSILLGIVILSGDRPLIGDARDSVEIDLRQVQRRF